MYESASVCVVGICEFKEKKTAIVDQMSYNDILKQKNKQKTGKKPRDTRQTSRLI
jgi:hypothetical protein